MDKFSARSFWCSTAVLNAFRTCIIVIAKARGLSDSTDHSSYTLIPVLCWLQTCGSEVAGKHGALAPMYGSEHWWSVAWL